MSSNNHGIDFKNLFAVSIIILCAFDGSYLFAQAPNADDSHPQTARSQNLSTRPQPENTSDLNKPPRKIHRIGTAIGAPPNSISIKSTDAGTPHRRPSATGCSNCGIIDFVNKIGQGPGLNAIASGVVAGTVAREIIRQSPPHPHGSNYQGDMSGTHTHGGNMAYPSNQYHIGITMRDGRQAIIALPEGSNFQQGDRVQLIDGTLVLDRQ